MARKDSLIKSKSIYTISKRHMNSTEGTIYEHDHITILQDDDIYDDEMALFSDSNFKYRIGKGNNQKKRHARIKWSEHEGPSATTWTKTDISAHTQTNEISIVNKPNYTSLKDFAYYGSAVELIHATINDIVARFPGGISYYGPLAPSFNLDGTTYYLVSNEFDIDCWSRGPIFSGDVKNPMRVLAASYENYVDKDGKQCVCPEFSRNNNECLNTIVGTVKVGKENLLVYRGDDGKNILVTSASTKTGTIIRPKQEIIDKFWDTLDDFERILLNRKTNPVYKAVLETPYKTEDGFFYREQSYTWPTVGNDGFTPDITTGAFQGYLKSLISLAEFHDEYDSDNIWRMMTHESIKNLDWTFIRGKNGEAVDASDLDSTRMQSMLHIYGRQFDDIKRNVDNIKHTNSISYNEKDNVPDYFLSDAVEIDGWEAQSVAPNSHSKTDVIYSGSTSKGTTSNEAGAEFLRRLALSSDYIQSLKGTRRGMESILNMFGYTKTDKPSSDIGTYNITEYISVATDSLPYLDTASLRLTEYVYDGENTNLMKGYPVAIVDSSPDDPNPHEDKYYLIPWFNKEERYNQPFYFQSKGGWGKRAEKEVSVAITQAKSISVGDGVAIYEETIPYMRFAENIDAMLSISNTEVKKNMVCYVTDISPLYKEYNRNSNDIGKTDFSHYFILKNTALSQYVGFVDNDIYHCYGWRNVFEQELKETLSPDGKRVIYLESLVSEWKGNNPHVGYGEYDDGREYIERFERIFGAAIEQGVYDDIKNDDYYKNEFEKAKECGFPIKENIEDNKKCHFFGSNFLKAGDDDYMNDADLDTEYQTMGVVNLNPNETYAYTESAADSVINIKKLRINFGIGGNKYLKKYIDDIVLKYLEPMIPSTAILEYTYDGGDIVYIEPYDCLSGGKGQTMNIVGHAAIINNDDIMLIEKNYNEEVK